MLEEQLNKSLTEEEDFKARIRKMKENTPVSEHQMQSLQKQQLVHLQQTPYQYVTSTTIREA
ncbi:hypothetical protein J6590_107694, partial [Homalodisca vitripennis]